MNPKHRPGFETKHKQYRTGQRYRGQKHWHGSHRKGYRVLNAEYFNRAFAHAGEEKENELTITIRRMGYERQMEVWDNLTNSAKNKFNESSKRLGYD